MEKALMKTTIREIAQMAGVSRGTVDRVVNGRPGVKPEIRENVLKIIHELNYVPNMAAKALAYNKNPITIGVIMPSRELAFFEEIHRGIDSAVREIHTMGIRVEIKYIESREPSAAAAVMDELLELGVSGIMISAMDHPVIQAKINEAADRKIPVITFNSDVSNCKRLCFVGQDLYKSGVVAAGLMSRVVPKGSSVIVLTGSMMFQAHRDRVSGFVDTFKKDGNVSVAEVVEGFDRYPDTYCGITKALGSYDNISGIYMATGNVNACLKAVSEKGLFGKLHIISNDTLPEVVDNMIKRIIDFTIVQDPFSQGYKPFRMLHEYIFSGKVPEEEYVFTEISIKIPENL